MNVSFVVPDFNKETIILQPWNHAFKIATGLASKGYNITLFTNKSPTKLSMKGFSGNFAIKELSDTNLRKINRENSAKITKDCNIIYFFGNPLTGTNLRKLEGINVPMVLNVSSVHYSLSELSNLSRHEISTHWLNIIAALPPIKYYVRNLNSKIITCIIASNTFIKERLCSLGVSAEKIVVEPLTFDPTNLVSTELPESPLCRNNSKRDFLVTYLGSPSTVRGTDDIVKAAYLLKSTLPKLRVFILSRRNLESENRDEKLLINLIRKLGLCEQVKVIPGILSKKELQTYLRESDVLTLPFKITLNEPPLAILEAMALGKPVITSSVCGLPQLVTSERGVLVKPGNPKNLASAIFYLSQNPVISDLLGKRAKEFVRSLPSDFEAVMWTRNLFSKTVEAQRAT